MSGAEVERLCELESWLRSEASKRQQCAKSRRESAGAMRWATEDELKSAKRLAEQMCGRKLNVSATVQSAHEGAELDVRIATKYEHESKKLVAFADLLSTLREQLAQLESRCTQLEEALKNLLDRHAPHSGYCVTVECNCPEDIKAARALLGEKGKRALQPIVNYVNGVAQRKLCSECARDNEPDAIQCCGCGNTFPMKAAPTPEGEQR